MDADIYVVQESKKNDLDDFLSAWKYKKWYGDDAEPGGLGVAVFSNTVEIEFSSTFNKEFRYVIPFDITYQNRKFVLFCVWTKPVPSYYDRNVIEAVLSAEYESIIKDNAILIGDFNTGSHDKDQTHRDYYKNLVMGLQGFKNAAKDTGEEYRPTFYYERNGSPYTNDFCFISKTMSEGIRNMVFKIYDEWVENKYKQKHWRGISDHCPIELSFEWC
jgi:exonuclease III